MYLGHSSPGVTDDDARQLDFHDSEGELNGRVPHESDRPEIGH